MPRTYTPGPAADAIVGRLLAKGLYSSADAAVRAGLETLRRRDEELDQLLRCGYDPGGDRRYTPGSEADSVVLQQLAKGRYSTADEVVLVGLQLLEQSEAEHAALMRLIDEGDAYGSA